MGELTHHHSFVVKHLAAVGGGEGPSGGAASPGVRAAWWYGAFIGLNQADRRSAELLAGRPESAPVREGGAGCRGRNSPRPARWQQERLDESREDDERLKPSIVEHRPALLFTR
jgi:hypothetical protein